MGDKYRLQDLWWKEDNAVNKLNSPFDPSKSQWPCCHVRVPNPQSSLSMTDDCLLDMPQFMQELLDLEHAWRTMEHPAAPVVR